MATLQAVLNPKIEDYNSLAEYVEALNKQQEFFYNMTSGGGIMGFSTHYSLIKYMRAGMEVEGYKESTYTAGALYKTKYFDHQGVEITPYIKEIDDRLWYIASAQDVVTNLWPLAVVIVAVAVVLITLIKNRK